MKNLTTEVTEFHGVLIRKNTFFLRETPSCPKDKHNSVVKKFVKLLLLICYLLIFISFAEADFSLRMAPLLISPLGDALFNTGMGASVSLDWAFIKSGGFGLGLGAGGGFASVSMQEGDPLTLFDGRGGLFVRYFPSFLRNADRWAFQLGLNAGVYQYSRGESSELNGLFGGTLGAQFHLSPYFSLFADGGYTYRVFSSEPLASVDIALGIRLNLSEIMTGSARVQAEKSQQYRVFPVSWAWYEDNPVAAVKVTNYEPNAITDLQLSFFMESYMSQPWVFAIVPRLASGESIEFPVTALFNEALLNLNQNVTANGILQMQYRSLGTKKEAVSPIQMSIFNRNTLSWDDDRRAAAFVSPNDSAVRLFARYVAAAVNSERRFTGEDAFCNTPANVVYATAMFEALRLYRISYVVDPSSSYVALSSAASSQDESAIDSLNYPYQTLYYRGGDCDDLSILFCSLLEAINIESAFITVPGHIYVAFEVGDDQWQTNNANIIELYGHDGIRRRWLPVEITVPGQGFSRAWLIGAQQWRNAGTEAELLPIRECWEIYPSVTVPASGDNPPELPEWEEIIEAMMLQLTGNN